MSGHHPHSADKPRTREAIALSIALVALALFGWLGTLQKETSLNVVVVPSGAKVRLLSPDPIEADVQLDRLATGGQAVFAHLPVGRDARVTVSAPGFRTAVATRTLIDGENRIEVRLQAELPVVSVKTSPNGAQVFVDNKARGPAPLILDDLAVGVHVVSARMNGYEPASQEILIQAGQDQRVELTLVQEGAPDAPASDDPTPEEKPPPPGYGRVVMTSNKSTTFLVENQMIAQGFKVTRDVLAGPHLLGCIAEGHGMQTRRVEIIEATVERVDCEFNEDPIERAMKVMDPKEPFYWTTLGASTRNQGQYGDSVDMFKKALELDPNYYEAHRQLGYTLPGMKRFEEAAEHLEKYIELNPHAPDLEFARDMIEVYHREAEKGGK
jgi:hypothetical protein